MTSQTRTERGRGSRSTRQRAEIRDALAACAEFRTAQRLHADLCARGRPVGLTTVYRVLAWLANRGEVDVMRLPSGEHLYRRCQASGHHHHLVCRRCGRTVEIDDLGVDIRAEQAAAQHGFTDVAHTIEIFGTCAACVGRNPQQGPGTSGLH